MAEEKQERYINPYTDFGFKKLFGTEMNKDLLISFLNSLFNNSEQEIKDVQYLNSEHLGDGYGDRRAVFDVYCMTADGGRFIVEMQKAEQAYFKDRSIYYSTYPIREQAEIARFTPQERREYQESVKDYWDYYSTMTTAHQKGRAEGLAEGLINTARKMKEKGFSVELIAEMTGLSSADIEAIK